jgi:serine/threonine protein kinase
MNLGAELELARKETIEKISLLKLNHDWITTADNGYKILETVGQGSFGQVVKAQCTVSKEIVAIKRISNFTSFDYNLVKVAREVMILRGLKQMAD